MRSRSRSCGALRADSAAAGTAATERYFDDHAHEQVHCGRLIRLHHMLDLAAVTATDPSATICRKSQLAEQAARENTQALNTILAKMTRAAWATCCSRRVRQEGAAVGPVRGRGAICRDLGLDWRASTASACAQGGVLLNDEELEYLGAPWPSYEREADRLGLDVFRLPMAEGFAPTKVAEMDAAMDGHRDRLHAARHQCAGALPRRRWAVAGLIACAWLLKMGFVADKPPRPKKKAERRRSSCLMRMSWTTSLARRVRRRWHDADDDAETILETGAIAHRDDPPTPQSQGDRDGPSRCASWSTTSPICTGRNGCVRRRAVDDKLHAMLGCDGTALFSIILAFLWCVGSR